MPTPSLTVDLVQFALVLCALLTASTFGVAVYLRSAPRHLRLWTMGGLGIAVGMTLIVMRSELDDFVSILLANLALIVGYTALAAGTRNYVERPAHFDLLLGGLSAVLFGLAYAADSPLAGRIIIISIFIALSSVSIWSGFARAWRSGRRGMGVRLALAALPLNVAVCCFRILMAADLLPEIGERVPIQTGLLALAVLATIGLAVALVTATLEAGGKPATADPAPDVAPDEAVALPAAEAEHPARRFAGWELVQSRRALVMPQGSELKLTGNEYLLLQRLFDGHDEPVPRVLLNATIGRGDENPKDRGVDILLSRLRRKCAEAGAELPVQSVRGRGYVFHGEARLVEGGTTPPLA